MAMLLHEEGDEDERRLVEGIGKEGDDGPVLCCAVLWVSGEVVMVDCNMVRPRRRDEARPATTSRYENALRHKSRDGHPTSRNQGNSSRNLKPKKMGETRLITTCIMGA